MTPEEWAAQLARSPEQRRQVLLWAKDEADAYGDLTIHGLAALCLHGQPFGFTREDVALLRQEADDEWPTDHPIWTQINALADRIAALLPPEP